MSSLKLYFKYCNKTLPSYFTDLLVNKTRKDQQTIRPVRASRPPVRFNDTVAEIPIFYPEVPINFTNKISCHKCIRHLIPDLINERFIPENVANKIHTHSMAGFISHVKRHILSGYSSKCNKVNCHICRQNLD